MRNRSSMKRRPASTYLSCAKVPSIVSPFLLIESCWFKCRYNNVELRNMTIRDCSLRYVQIHGSVIHSSTFDNCQLFNCTVFDSNLLESELHETKIMGCSLKSCKSTASPLAFRKFPPEIREMIFQRCIGFNGNTPPLFIALRGDQELYKEALGVFCKLNYFRLSKGSMPVCESMSPNVIENVYKLRIS
jgi:hypothetical protein